MNWLRLLLVAGLGLFGVGAVELLAPGTVPVPRSELLVTAFAVVTLLYAVVLAARRWNRQRTRADTPDVEIPSPSRSPDTDRSEILDRFPGPEDLYGGRFEAPRRRLKTAAVAVLSRHRGLDLSVARERVATGGWTDDDRAANYLADHSEVEPGFSIHRLFATESARERSRRRTVDAIAAAAGVTSDDADTACAPLDGPVTVRTGGRADSVATQTGHWTGVSLVVLVCVGVGLLAESPSVLLGGVIGLGYAAYARLTPLDPLDLSAARSLSDTDPDPGDTVQVTVTLTNRGGFCPDLRIVDGVPGSLAVSEGSPRHGAVLRAGESVTFSYSVTATAGAHEFDPVLVVGRNLSGSAETERLVPATATVQVVPSPTPVQAPVPLRRQQTRYAGTVSTHTGGEGTEFHTVREYHPGDSVTRIDWNRRARTGELTTVQFRPERATRVVLLVDTRRSARAGTDPAAPDAVERSVEATQRLFPTLLDDGHQVGIAAFGAGEFYLAPDTGRRHRKRGRERLATAPAFNGGGTEARPWYWIPRLRTQLPADTQLLVLSPLLEPKTVRIVRQLEAYGYPTTVLSPDPTAADTPGRRLLSARRRLLLGALRSAGIPVLDWDPSTPLETVLRREVTGR